MTKILADYTASISELKKSPSSVIEKAGDEAVAILNHNKPMAYLVPSALYEEMIGIIEEHSMGRVAEEKLAYGVKKRRLTKSEISKIVGNSQRIEGYEPASEEMKRKVEAFMKMHNIKVSMDNDDSGTESYLEDWDGCDV